MPKKRKTFKAKEPVRIRFKKLANGNQSIYLDRYIGGRRSYEFLHLYLVPETDEFSRVQNANTMRAAVAIKSQRVNEIASGKAGIRNCVAASRIPISEWISLYMERKERDGYKAVSELRTLAKHLREYRGAAMVGDIDKDFLLGFQDWLIHGYRKRSGGSLSRNSVNLLMRLLNAACSVAVRDGVLAGNPFSMIDRSEMVKPQEGTREFLTIDEIRRLIRTECCNTEVKCAFLFACFCGLRISDVRALRWDDIQEDGGRLSLTMRMRKTGERIYLPLVTEAVRWLPAGRGGQEGNVFRLPTRPAVTRALALWADAAGIRKHVTFHVSRHTFATLELTLGADLYTVSKLLGHSNVRTTEIYAKIIDRKKDEAVGLINKVDWG